MSVSPDEFRKAQGYWLSLEKARTSANGQITAVKVIIQGIVGCKDARRRTQQMRYSVLIDVQDLSSGLPNAWIVSASGRIEHLNVWLAGKKYCPITGSKLPYICWGKSASAWQELPPSQRTLASLLEVTTQILSHVNPDSPARILNW
jgi:hypothetical protein